MSFQYFQNIFFSKGAWIDDDMVGFSYHPSVFCNFGMMIACCYVCIHHFVYKELLSSMTCVGQFIQAPRPIIVSEFVYINIFNEMFCTVLLNYWYAVS